MESRKGGSGSKRASSELRRKRNAQSRRGQGLLIGWVLAPDWEGRAREIMKAAQAAGVFVLVAGPNVVRFAPSLVIPKEDIEDGLERLEQAVIGLSVESSTTADG